jgi:hypothetical protein
MLFVKYQEHSWEFTRGRKGAYCSGDKVNDDTIRLFIISKSVDKRNRQKFGGRRDSGKEY